MLRLGIVLIVSLLFSACTEPPKKGDPVGLQQYDTAKDKP